jgi:acyl-CoA hydrolase
VFVVVLLLLLSVEGAMIGTVGLSGEVVGGDMLGVIDVLGVVVAERKVVSGFWARIAWEA